MWPGTLSVYACVCMRVHVCLCTVCILVPPSCMYMHVCTRVHMCVHVCTHLWMCRRVSCVSWVEMPLFRGSDQALLQNAVLRVAAPRVFTGVTYGLWVLLKPRPCF